MAAATSMEELEKQVDFTNLDGTLNQLQSGAAQLNNGAQNLTGVLNSLQAGAAQLDDGASILKDQLDQSLLPGLSAAGTLQQKLNEEMKAAQQVIAVVPETDSLQAAVGTVTQALTSAASGGGSAAQNAVASVAANASAAVQEQCLHQLYRSRRGCARQRKICHESRGPEAGFEAVARNRVHE